MSSDRLKITNGGQRVHLQVGIPGVPIAVQNYTSARFFVDHGADIATQTRETVFAKISDELVPRGAAGFVELFLAPNMRKLLISNPLSGLSPMQMASVHYMNLFQIQEKQRRISELEQRANGRVSHEVENSLRRMWKVTQPNASAEFTQYETSSLDVLRHIARLKQPLTASDAGEIMDYMQVPQTREEATFMLELALLGYIGKNVLPEEAADFPGVEAETVITFRNAGANIESALKTYLFACMAGRLNGQRGARSQEIDLSDNAFVADIVGAYVFMMNEDLHPEAFAKFMDSLIIGMDEGIKELLIAKHKENYLAKYHSRHEKIRDERGKFPYLLAQESTGVQGRGVDLFMHLAHQLPQTSENISGIAELVGDGMDTIQGTHAVLSTRLMKNPATILERELTQKIDGIKSIDLAAPTNEFIDVIVVGQDNSAFLLQIDKRGRVFGLPHPYDQKAARVARYVLENVVAYARRQNIIKDPTIHERRRNGIQDIISAKGGSGNKVVDAMQSVRNAGSQQNIIPFPTGSEQGGHQLAAAVPDAHAIPLTRRQGKMIWYSEELKRREAAEQESVADLDVSSQREDTIGDQTTEGVMDVAEKLGSELNASASFVYDDEEVSESDVEVGIMKPLLSTPKFLRDFSGLSSTAREEVERTLAIVKEGGGTFKRLHNIPRGVKLFSCHGKNGDNFRVILVAKSGIIGVPKSEIPNEYYALAVHPRGHNYSDREIRAIALSIVSIPSWEKSKKIHTL